MQDGKLMEERGEYGTVIRTGNKKESMGGWVVMKRGRKKVFVQCKDDRGARAHDDCFSRLNRC
jgi:hypothetical protein